MDICDILNSLTIITDDTHESGKIRITAFFDVKGKRLYKSILTGNANEDLPYFFESIAVQIRRKAKACQKN